MDKRVYLLMIVSFVAGLVELIIVGILDLVAADLGIKLLQAGLFISAFSVTFAISAPVLLLMTRKIERKKLLLLTLTAFFFANVFATVSHTFCTFMIARMISAMSAALLVVLSITIASKISTPEKRGRAIGLVYMGVSGSLVLGVPIGVLIGNMFSWQAPFIFISLLTLLAMIGIYFLLPPMEPSSPVPWKEQWNSIKNKQVIFAHLSTLLFLAGHYTLYGYLSPYLKLIIGMEDVWMSVVYWVFGIAAITGGGLGGMLSDRVGIKATAFSVIFLFIMTFILIPLSSFIPVFIVLTVIWGAMSWALSPPLQNHLYDIAPNTSDIQQSMNNSALHFGIAFGSFIGGVVIEWGSLSYNPYVGAFFALLAFSTLLLSFFFGRDENWQEKRG